MHVSFMFFSRTYYSTNKMGESDLEDSATHPFDPEEWIGKGRKLPSPNDIPQGLAEYFHSLKEIPTEIINQHFPKTHFDIETFLVYEPPKGTFGLVNSSPIDSFRLAELSIRERNLLKMSHWQPMRKWMMKRHKYIL